MPTIIEAPAWTADNPNIYADNPVVTADGQSGYAVPGTYGILWTADQTAVTADSWYFTADGAGGPPAIPYMVQAVTSGVYQGVFYQPGDIFQIASAHDYSDSTLNYETNGGEYAPGWMIYVAQETPPYQAQTAAPYPTFPIVDPARVFIV